MRPTRWRSPCAICTAARCGSSRSAVHDRQVFMIGFLRGRILAKHPPGLMVDVNGVGYELEAPMSTFYGLPAAGAEVGLYTHLVVREDAHILFGFATEQE